MEASTVAQIRAIAADQAGVTARIQAAEQVGAVQAELDALFTAKGDLPVATASEDAAALSVGANGQTLVADSSTASGLTWGYRPFSLVMHDTAAAVVWTDMPAAATLWQGSHAHVRKVDLTNYRQARILVNKQSVAGFAGSVVELKYATTFQTTAGGYSTAGASAIQVAVDVANAVQVSAWIDLLTPVRADVFLALVGTGGDGGVDPTFGVIEVQFR